MRIPKRPSWAARASGFVEAVLPVTFANSYHDAARAAAYATLAYPGTYALAFRDLPVLIAEHVRGATALDFGCGAGRSTRFLRGLGFDVVGVDISAEMLAKAREADPSGDYRLVADGDFSGLGARRFDLVLGAFTFDNVPDPAWRARLLRGLAGLLAERGRIVLVDSTPELYVNDWASFSTRDFPGNRSAGSGDLVKVVMTDVEDRRPVEDVLWRDEDYRALFQEAGLKALRVHRPLARGDEPVEWVNETRIAPWVVYVVAHAG